MARERCWKCRKLSNDVELRACDDRLCESCYRKNEEELADNRHRANGNAASVSASAPRRVSLASSASSASVTKKGAKKLATPSGSTPAPPVVVTAAAINEASMRNSLKSAMQTSDHNQQSPVRVSESDTFIEVTRTDLSVADQISQLSSIVHQQQDTINLLTEQLKFVMSILGIDESALQLADNGRIAPDHNGHAMKAEVKDAPAAETNQEKQPSLWTEVVKRRSKPQLTNLQQSLVAAVYTDQIDKKRRESTLIVSGLLPDTGASDKLLVTNLCRNEFGLQPDITMVKRIGHRQPGKKHCW